MTKILGFICAGLIAFAPNPAPAADPVTINAIITETGAGAFLGHAQVQVLNAIERATNKEGGINGRPIKFVILDDASNPQTSIQLLNDLIGKKVPVVLGSSLTGPCNAMMPLAKNGPVQYCFSPGIYPQAGGFTFVSGISFADQASAIVRYFKASGAKRVALISTTDASGVAIEKSIEDALATDGAGMTVVDRETYAPTDLTIDAQIAKIKAATPDIILTASSGTPTGTLLHGIANSGMPDIPALLGAGNASYAQMQAYKSFLPKNLFFPVYPSLAESEVSNTRERAAIVKYRADMKAEGVTVDVMHATAWDPTMLVVSVLKKLGPNASAEQIRDYLSSMSGFVGTDGIYDFKNRPQRGLDSNSIYIARWDEAKATWIPVSGAGGSPIKK